MTGPGIGGDGDPEQVQWPPVRPRTDYAGAVFGSLLAASVVAGAGALGTSPRVELTLLLLVTGLVFWVAHVYAHVVGERLLHQPLTWGEVRSVCLREWPIAEAAVLPAAAVAISPLLGLGLSASMWLALAVAVAQQVGWASAALIRAGATRGAVVVAGLINLLLGLVIVAAKGALH